MVSTDGVAKRPDGTWAADVDELSDALDEMPWFPIVAARARWPRIPELVLEHIFSDRRRRRAARKAS